MKLNVFPSFHAGLDEVGRGPLAGPVIAAAVILDPAKPIDGLNDSKLLSEKKREYLTLKIKECALSWAIGRAEVEEIDTINILQASFLAMQRAFHALKIKPECAIVDGKFAPQLPCQVIPVIGGDRLVPAVSAASIIAKVARDHEMIHVWAMQYPEYEFQRHKGYGTERHRELLKRFGPTPIHRKSFAPVKELIQP